MGDYSHEMPVDLEKERLITVAKNVSAQMNKNVRLPINSSFMCDGRYPSVNERAVNGKFRFWGSFESKFRYTNRGSVTAIIKDLIIPQQSRGAGLGKEIVSAWEKAARQQGVRFFAATNIKPEAIEFWLKMGYRIPAEEEYKSNPYCMVKF